MFPFCHVILPHPIKLHVLVQPTTPCTTYYAKMSTGRQMFLLWFVKFILFSKNNDGWEMTKTRASQLFKLDRRKSSKFCLLWSVSPLLVSSQFNFNISPEYDTCDWGEMWHINMTWHKLWVLASFTIWTIIMSIQFPINIS